MNNVNEAKKEGYVTGVLSLIVSLVLTVIAVNSGWNMTGQLFGGIGLIFGCLGVGSLFKPDVIGPIAYGVLANFAKTEKQRKSRYSQHPVNSPNSPSVINRDGTVIVQFKDK